MKFIKALTFILIFLKSLIFTPFTHAQSISLSLSPPVTEVMIKPGVSVSQTYLLTNNGDDTILTFQILALDGNGIVIDDKEKIVPWLEIVSAQLISPSSLNQENPTKTPVSAAKGPSNSLPSPIQTDLAQKFQPPPPAPITEEIKNLPLDKPFLFKKSGQLKMLVKISPPIGTPQQDYYQSLAFSTAPISANISRSAIKQSLNSLILISVTDSGLPKQAKITIFNLPRIVDSFDGINIDLAVKNTGQTFFHINGQLLLKGLIGQAKFPIIPRIHLTGQEKEILIDSPNTKKISGFFLGKYTLKADFILDEGSLKVDGEKVFYALPWKMLSVLIAAAMLMKKRSSKK
ncbi:hypothetical protein A2W14_05030 [Candidatus Gottesmanbacteria bacterium RBG_16_37_8]|uniref:Uncharacterized protein n=1 Tax=Candidatus Gottesmanbacteria bacterium RBG_16_37_8 TaxID=1798371 RepID=A0A1F5YUD1_9BACT|nr:MAG: hypothetical protein A2W14_05030 [Candidatus Gottesmanbacteria bacterium RBG_16_37_8]